MSIEALEEELVKLDSRSRNEVLYFLVIQNRFSKLRRLQVPEVKSFLKAMLEKADLRYQAST